MKQFYKPNPKKTGHACSFNVVSSGDSAGVYLEIIKQTGWDGKKKTGSFKEGKKVTVKFSEMEVGSFLNTLRRNSKFSAYHTSEKGSTQILFQPYSRGDEQVGYSLSVKSGNESFLIGFYFNEAIVLENFFENCLDRFFAASYNEQKKRRQNASEKS